MDDAHQIWKIVEEDHNAAMATAYKRYNTDWGKDDQLNKELEEDFYRNAEAIAIVDAPLNSIELVYHELVYTLPSVDPEDLI